MADIGTPTPTGSLNLPTVGDWEYQWEMRESDAPGAATVPFPVGSQVWLLIGAAGSTQTRWDFTIAGAVASIKKESTDVALVDPGVPYWLMFSPAVTVPTTEREIQTGKVRKVNAR